MSGNRLEFFLVHPGGPFFRNKDAGAWTIPKGLVGDAEPPLAAAQREFVEETGYPLPDGPFLPVGHIVQKGGKRVDAWVVRAELDPATLSSNLFEMEWPPRSGRRASFPEVDRGAWFGRAEAERKILAAQVPFLDRAELLMAITP